MKLAISKVLIVIKVNNFWKHSRFLWRVEEYDITNILGNNPENG